MIAQFDLKSCPSFPYRTKESDGSELRGKIDFMFLSTTPERRKGCVMLLDSATTRISGRNPKDIYGAPKKSSAERYRLLKPSSKQTHITFYFLLRHKNVTTPLDILILRETTLCAILALGAPRGTLAALFLSAHRHLSGRTLSSIQILCR